MESSNLFQRLKLPRTHPIVTIVTKLTENESSVAIRLPLHDTEHAVVAAARNEEFLNALRLG